MVASVNGTGAHHRPAISRRSLLRGAGLAAVGTLAAWGVRAGIDGARSRPTTPIEHVIVSCQENRSFDHYFGYAPWIGEHGPPPGFSQPDGRGHEIEPYHFGSLTTSDPPHHWTAAHEQWNGGRMDGFFRSSGRAGLGYYLERDLPFYYGLFEKFTLCVRFFSSVMGPTYPNRFYLAAGTSGGITTNGVWGYRRFDYPMILDLLEAAGITWKVYNVGWDQVLNGDSSNVFVFWTRWAGDRRTRATMGDYLRDLRTNRLPQVSFIVPSFRRGFDEHPPADVSIGMGLQERLIGALRASTAWPGSAFILTYDEHGGYFDHVPPPQIDPYGLGMRIPTWIVSPWAKPAHLDATTCDLTSILKFIERNWDLPTLASINHRFDEATRGGINNDASNSANVGPPAPPRDGRDDLGDLMSCFDF